MIQKLRKPNAGITNIKYDIGNIYFLNVSHQIETGYGFDNKSM